MGSCISSRKVKTAQIVSNRVEMQVIDMLTFIENDMINRHLQSTGLHAAFPSTDTDFLRQLVVGSLNHIGFGCLLTATIYVLKKPVQQARYVAILLNEGADPNHKDENGLTPLMHACFLGAERAAKELISWKDTDLYAKDEQGKTALMYAAGEGQLKILKCYCKALRKEQKHGNDIDIMDARTLKGETARDLAAAGGFNDCLEVIDAERSKRMRTLSRKTSHGAITGRLSPIRQKLKPVGRAGSFDSLFNEDGQQDSLVEDKWSNQRSMQYVLKYGDKSAPDEGSSRDDIPDVSKNNNDSIPTRSPLMPEEGQGSSRHTFSEKIRHLFMRRHGHQYRSSASAHALSSIASESPVRGMRRSKTGNPSALASTSGLPVEPKVLVRNGTPSESPQSSAGRYALPPIHSPQTESPS